MTDRLAAIRNTFPNAGETLVITSPATRQYNCVAWAVNDVNNWWWPGGGEDAYWPPGVPRECSVRAFVLALGAGYVPCAGDELEPGFEKVAIYAKTHAMDKPTHAARQRPDGLWTSKLGPDEDVHHTLKDLEGKRYGRVVKILKRPLPVSPA